MTCEGPADDGCPSPIVLAPDGSLAAPWLPPSTRGAAGSAAFPSLRQGTYRTLLVGGADDARGEVSIRALGAARTIRFARGGLQTIASTVVFGR